MPIRIQSAPALELYFTDLNHRPLRLGYVKSGYIYDLDLPIQQPIAVHARFDLPAYGYCWLTADNQGSGYQQGTLDLLSEVWTSQVARVQRRKAQHQLDASTEAAQALWQADQRLEALRELVLAGENLELRQAQHNLATGQSFAAPLISSTLFHCGPSWLRLNPQEKPNILRPREQMLAIAEVADDTVLPNFWGWVEHERGNYLWEQLDTIAGFADDHNLTLKSFAICWGGSLPPWFKELGFSAQLKAIEQWAEALIGRYGSQIQVWEFINEIHDWGFANPCRWNHAQILQIAGLVSDIVGGLAPGKPRVINNCLVWGEYVRNAELGGPWSPLTFQEAVINAGIAYEGIGLQWIYRVGGTENRDLLECALHLERFAGLGKQLYLTEVGAPSSPRLRGAGAQDPVDPAVGWHGTWSETNQAEWLEELYLIAANLGVAFMNWWDFADYNSFIVNGGMIDSEGRRKPVYQRWRELCQKQGWGQYKNN
ncbi:MAG: endo-1,4-beta-xylanase [Anaerolineae bacterium]